MRRRRSVWQICVSGGIAAVLAASCSPADEAIVEELPTITTSSAVDQLPTSTPVPSTTEARLKPYGGEARLWGEPPRLNPWPDEANSFDYAVFDAFTVGALRANWDTAELEADVITQFPTLENEGLVENPDGSMTVHYTIRSEAVWADGQPVSGDDFAFTYDVAVDPEHGDRWLRYYEMIIPESIEYGPKWFSYTMESAGPGWLRLFEFLVPRHDVEGRDFLADFNDTAWVSAGPFEFESWDRGEQLVLRRNDNYWRTDPATGQRLPYLDRLVLGDFTSERIEATQARLDPELHELAAEYILDWQRFIEEHGWELAFQLDEAMYPAELERFTAGEVHSLSEFFILVTVDERLDDVERLTATPGIGGGAYPSGLWDHFSFHLGEQRLETNPDSWNVHREFREAVALALDRDRIVEELWGGLVEPMHSYTAIVSPTLDRAPWAEYEFDPDAARRHLTQLCAKLGQDCATDPPVLHFKGGNRYEWWELGDLLVDMLGEVGIAVVSEDVGIIDIGVDSWDTTAFGWDVSFGVDALATFHDVFDPDQADPDHYNNPYRWCTWDSPVSGPQCDRYRELLIGLRSTPDLEEALVLAAEAEQILADDLFVIPLYRRPRFRLWRTDLLADTVATYGGPLGGAPLHNCDRWYVPEGAD